jgi:hypothetical protein
VSDALRRNGERLDRSAFDEVFTDDFNGATLSSDRWIDHYLPHWTTPNRSAARYTLDGNGLQLLIEADQPAWLPDDGELRVSNIQTGTASGPAGSPVGPMAHRPGLRVQTPQAAHRLFTPAAGLVEATLQASPDPTVMLAFWLVGFADPEQDSGEICVVELFGNTITPDRAGVNIGVKAHRDPRLHDDMETITLDIDATQPHTYAAAWNAERVQFFVDDHLVRTVDQGLDYPLFLLVDLFEFPDSEIRDPGAYPKTGRVTAVRGYRHRP